MGGAHVFQPDLYRVTYEPTGLGFTCSPFAALWFAPLAHLPARLVQVLFAAGAFVVAEGVAFVTSPHASWAYWTHCLWDPGRAGGLARVGNQGAVGVIERLVHHRLSSLAMFALVAVISGIGLLIAVKSYRQSWPVLGFLVVEATGALASPVSWSHHFVWVVLLIAWLALAPDRPVRGEWWAIGVAVMFWAAPFRWVSHGSDGIYAGHGWSIPLSDSFFVVMTGILPATSWRLIRRRARRSAWWARCPQTGQTACGSFRVRHHIWFQLQCLEGPVTGQKGGVRLNSQKTFPASLQASPSGRREAAPFTSQKDECA